MPLPQLQAFLGANLSAFVFFAMLRRFVRSLGWAAGVVLRRVRRGAPVTSWLARLTGAWSTAVTGTLSAALIAAAVADVADALPKGRLTSVWQEAGSCQPAAAPKPHAIFALVALGGLLLTSHMLATVGFLGTLFLVSRASPLAGLLAVLAVLEQQHEFDALVLLARSVVFGLAATVALAHFAICDVEAEKAPDALLVFYGAQGAVRWFVRANHRAVAELATQQKAKRAR